MRPKSEERIDRQIRRINELEDAGHWSDAARAREARAVFTETRDGLRLCLKVAAEVGDPNEISSWEVAWYCCRNEFVISVGVPT